MTNTLLGDAYLIEEFESCEGNAEDFLNHGMNFSCSASVLNQNVKSLGPHAYASIYFCIGHSYELLLKSFLLHKDFSYEDLKNRNIRHDLDALLDEVKKQGFPISSDHEYEIREINKYYKTHEFRYPFMGDKFLRDTDLLIDVSQKLHAQISTLMRDSKKAANDQN